MYYLTDEVTGLGDVMNSYGGEGTLDVCLCVRDACL